MSDDDRHSEAMAEAARRWTAPREGWQVTPPREAGWYWCKGEGGDDWEAGVVRVQATEHGMVFVNTFGDWRPTDRVEGYEWWPIPLTPPEVPE